MMHEPEDETPMPGDAGDPEDAELVAYLDGELDDDAERALEARLAADPQLRARAAALKKTYDLLDFLPRCDPSPTFATRTVEKLPAVKSNPEVRPAPAPPPLSSSVPVVLNTSGVPFPATGRSWFWPAALLAGVAALAGGFALSAALRSQATPTASESPEPSGANAIANDAEPPSERVLELLPLYAPALSLDFVRELATDPELFAEDAEGHASVVVPPRVPWAADLPALAKAYRALPAERQKQIRALDQQLHLLAPAERTPLLRALEAYAAWLYRTSESERFAILSASTSKDRLEEVREARRTQWVATLPAVQQKQIKGLPAAERAALMVKWREEEGEHRKAWTLPGPTREAIRLGKPPYPFDSEDLKKQVVEYARAAYRFDDKDRVRSRLSPKEQSWLIEAYELGRDENAWLWFGKLLYDLSWRYEMLPEPDGRPPVTDIPQLWEAARLHFSKGVPRQRVQRTLGRWPEFALVAHDEWQAAKLGPPPADFSFGPASPREFREPTRQFVERELLPSLRPIERFQLNAFEGQWPQYPRLVVQLARKHDRSVPGAMLPGRPSEWDRTYGGSPKTALRPKG